MLRTWSSGESGVGGYVTGDTILGVDVLCKHLRPGGLPLSFTPPQFSHTTLGERSKMDGGGVQKPQMVGGTIMTYRCCYLQTLYVVLLVH